MSVFKRLFTNSSLVPLAKIANAKDRSVRIVWAIFTATMCVGLLICISFVVRQYMQHQTAFQLDSSPEDFIYDQLPGVTICPNVPTASSIRQKWVEETGNKGISFQEIVYKLKKEWIRKNSTWDYRAKAYFLPSGKYVWDSEVDAISPAYSNFYHFKIQFDLGEIQNRNRIFILEQIPNDKLLLCTTFEFRPIESAHTWSSLKFTIEQNENQPAKLNHSLVFTMILHERGMLPFSAYDRFIYSEIRPERDYSVYMSKSVIKMLNTKKNPCHESQNAKSLYKTLNISYIEDHGNIQMDRLDELRLESMKTENPSIESSHGGVQSYQDNSIKLFGTNYLYTRESCGWEHCCQTMVKLCKAHCSTEIFGFDIHKQNRTCQNELCVHKPISYDICPGTCVTARFTKQNFIESLSNENYTRTTTSVNIHKSNDVDIAVEEEIFTLAKLFSEIGGLCSLFIGFSSTFIFELLEGLLYLKPAKRLFRLNSTTLGLDEEKEIKEDDSSVVENERIQLTSVEKKIIPLILSTPSLAEFNSSDDGTRALPVLNNIEDSFKREELLQLLRNGQVKFQIKFSSQSQ